MMDFSNYVKPQQLHDIEEILFAIGFNKEIAYFNNFFTYKYDKWVATIEHQPHDNDSEEIKFDLMKMEFFNLAFQNNPKINASVHELLFHGNDLSFTPYKDILSENLLNEEIVNNYLTEYYIDDLNRFKNKVIYLLKETFKAEIRKSKIKKLF